ncbi:nitrate- and nitrite sensing domain-containing protein [Streptacidiphilus sp. ASG 303]|uniref:sensor histidine kinase n=1 Tax=Streptacidiphilus sp. ASG 303 TaxID=2896847 RepID=UPI001E61EA13|nr:ATP-binding protein [Streptacidiphilus sp. ASG 303]MCD0485487.1 nitrate- and nitrite sensing domain-containing protein [Streptacidiphilus sp. ASG 303]
MTIRSKLTALLLLPLVSLAALWAYAAYLSLGNALTLSRVNTIGTHLARPLGKVVIGLQAERRSSLVALVGNVRKEGPGGVPVPPELARSRAGTDSAVAAFLAEADDPDVRKDENDRVRRSVDAARQALEGITDLRKGVDAGVLAADRVLASYTMVNAAISEAFDAMTVLPDQDAQDFGRALHTLVLGGDFLSQEDALVSAAAAGPSHRLGRSAYAAVVQDIGPRRYLNRAAVAGLPPAQRAPFLRLSEPGGPLQQVAAMEQQIIDAGPDARALPFPIARWRAAYDAQWNATNRLALDDIDVVFTLTGPPATRALVELLLAGLLGLVALVVSVVLSVRIARSLVGDLGRLRTSARNLTDDRLRDVVGRLRRGETVDVAVDTARPEFVNREMARLGDAFLALQSTAVELAAEDIRLHRGFSEVFLNLARRSQALVHRQLSLLDTMERQEDDPGVLENLYRLDQLATRLRRYAEGLIIVSGAAPGRVWRRPVPAVDVVRAAVAETEDYARVVVPPVPDVGIAGRAAADVIHLLAELVENAQNFSPSDSEIRVSVGTGAGGLIVEIDDRGLGMAPEDLEAANARITSPVDISDVDSTRLGLITVGRLAQRHKVNVALRSSPYGGLTAVVLIPHALLEQLPPRDAAQLAPAAAALPPAGPHGHAGDPYGHDRQPGATAHAMPAPPHREGTAFPEGPPLPGVADALAAPVPQVHAAQQVHAAPPPVVAASAAPETVPNAWQGHHQVPAARQPETIDGLPRRVRQASLAPQLKDDPAAAAGPLDWGGASAHAVRAPAGPVPHPGAPLPGGAGTAADPGPWPGDPFGSVPQVRPAGPAPAADGNRGAPPLFEAAFSSAGARPPAPAAHGGRPTQVRSLMSALQSGAARGRLEQPVPGGGPEPRPRRPHVPHHGNGSTR